MSKITCVIAARLIVTVIALLVCVGCSPSGLLTAPVLVETQKPVLIAYAVDGGLVKTVEIHIDNPGKYANFSLYADDQLLVDSLNIPKSGNQVMRAAVKFEALGDVELKLLARDSNFIVNSLKFTDISDLDIPAYLDISKVAGLDKVSSIKYGGPTVADFDMDGDYDFIVNNHNAESTKLYWNNGDGTVTKHDKNIARWFMHDLHGTAPGDYDNDGDLDIVVTQGGGNGTNPSKANFYHNQNGTLVLMTGDVGIDRGGRGRGAKWSDMDLDGDLDLMLFNEASLKKSKPQHFFYENLGDSKFQYKSVSGLEDVHQSRVMITDFNNDNIDDFIMYGPLSLWKGNGDFTFTDVSSQVPKNILSLNNIMAIADIDIDNDGDFDLYLARGKEFEYGLEEETTSLDHDPLTEELSIKPRGRKGVDQFEFTASEDIKLHGYDFLAQGTFRGKDYPIFLGSQKSATVLKVGEDMTIQRELAEGWPEDISENGAYFGYLGNSRWRAALVRDGDIFWTYKFSLSGVSAVTPEFSPQNRNESDILLRNDGGAFVDVSKGWNIPLGGNALGVSVGDFNNDSRQDVFIYRWGYIGARISDLMLLNTGEDSFETVTMHGASDVGGPGNGDMGQAFDFDLDGDLDFLSGSEGGEWYLYSNTHPGSGHYALVKVGYSPVSNVDPMSAEVIIKTPRNQYRKRVGSAGAIFSQSLLNIVHFGLGEEEVIESIKVRWRNGETAIISDKRANALFNTDNVDPISISLQPELPEVRKGSTVKLKALTNPVNADDSIIWSSSDESVLTVNANGVVTAKGDVGDLAVVTAKSVINDIARSSDVTITKWVPRPLDEISVSSEVGELLQGDTLKLQANLLPKNADDTQVKWTSSDSTVAKVDETGIVTAVEAGDVIISVMSLENKDIRGEIKLSVNPVLRPFIRLHDEESFKTREFVVGESITMNVDYHAGSGNKVIASDEGGMRFWLRHFKYKWIPAKDITLIDPTVIGTESGTSTMTISLEDLTPTAQLPEGHFYYLRASFATSDGKRHDVGIYPINIVDAQIP